MTLHETKRSRTELLAEFFRAHPNVWIDGRRLGELAGGYAWRTRVSDVRRPPFSLVIENRQRRVRTTSGATVTVSEYRHSIAAPAAQGLG
jgi:hypothetical protein